MIEIDGTYGEGGGQILRTSLSLSAILGAPVTLTGIRAKRPKPGLRPQHLTGLLAMTDVTRAEAAGMEVGSTTVRFRPGRPKPGRYFFDVSKTSGSAGSVSLIIQTVLPALALAGAPSRVTLVGGTHVPWSPPFQFVQGSFLKALAGMGVHAGASIESWGFYPKGGGRVTLDVEPSVGITPVELTRRGELTVISGLSAVANLPVGIAERQARAAAALLHGRGLDADIRTVEAPSPGQGTFICLSADFGGTTLDFTALGERGKRAEAVGEEAANSLLAFLDSGACVDEHLADQLLLYMALANGVSRMSVSKVTKHLLTNAWVIGRFLPGMEVVIDGAEGEAGTVTVRPAS